MSDWPFADSQDTQTVTSRLIAENRQDILIVVHEKRGGVWRFLDDGEAFTSDTVLLPLEEVAVMDPTILPLSNLPRGWQAWRRSPLEDWNRLPIPPEGIR